MLFLFFLKRFYKKFFIFFISLILILSASDLFVRLPIVSSISVLPKVFLLMLPLMAQFAIPLASCLAVQSVLGHFYVEDEIILIYFFSEAKDVLKKAILFFSISILFFYVPIVTTWAPKSYKKGKILILDLAKKHFSDLQPNKFHSLSKNFTIFFEKQKRIDNNVQFFKILLMFKEKKGDRFIINANKGFLSNDVMYLENGVMQNVGSEKTYIANFDKTEIDLKKFLNLDDPKFKIKDLKFFTLKELSMIKKENLPAFIEYHKRIAQIIWQFLFPFLSLFLIMLFAKRKSNLLISVFLSGFLFLISYILLNTVKTLYFLDDFVIILFYLPFIFILIAASFLFSNRFKYFMKK
ncbi:LptF/LptG family permease [Candidatus Dependentiae bacterium]|nr:LptF/LptG family permease [Candidatus Dependentiae bacterium]